MSNGFAAFVTDFTLPNPPRSFLEDINNILNTGEARCNLFGVVKGATRSDRTLLVALLTLLLGARMLLGAPGLTTSNKKLLLTKGIATRCKELSWQASTQSAKSHMCSALHVRRRRNL